MFFLRMESKTGFFFYELPGSFSVSHEKIKGNVGKPISGEVGNIPIIQKPGN